jgi:hypothetical protein
MTIPSCNDYISVGQILKEGRCEYMKSVNICEMRQIEGGIPWAFIIKGVAGLSAYARYLYEHSRYGRHYTNYGWLNLTCPICGRP